ncbi:BON domain-containing protein [Gemmatimonas phototrophica]|uniref:BON domain-containing protein n=1 Tax=Gemmatimonas phototrophica TaxID=1379270 RepID=UPI000AA24DAD|nr:BON domain-containing protein [Gemmatimonas phototrophica]
MALGAVAGLAIGMAIADRAGGMDGLLRRKTSRRQRRHREDGWRGDERRSQTFDELEDDDSELAPEAISHLHLRGRYPEPSSRSSHPSESYRTPPRRPVVPAATSGVDPVELEERVLEVFRNDLLLAERTIDIGANDEGVIELTGWVEAASEAEYAVVLAKGVPDVAAVVSLLAVSGQKL